MSYDKLMFRDSQGTDREVLLGAPESHAKPQTGQAGTLIGVQTVSAAESLSAPQVLLIDIECSPNLAYVWDVWNQNVKPDMLVETQEILCFAYKWLGYDETFFWSQFHHTKSMMLSALWNLMNMADVVIDYNGSRYDILHINRELLIAGYTPPSPYQHIDLFKTVKRKFKFTYMSLNHVCKQLGLTSKLDNGGFETWLGCMRGDKDSWDKLVKYNMGDIPPLEELYLRLRPWISAHPNLSLYAGERRCPHCMSTNVQFRGWRYTPAGKYRRMVCNSCGAWSRLAKREATTDTRTAAD